LTAKLADCDYAVDFSEVTSPNDRVAVIATAPLTIDEEWTEFKRGQLLMFDNGLPYSELYDCQEVEQQGRGLSSRVLQRSESALCYDTPTLLRQLVDSVVDKGSCWAERGADLGCGAGLSGAAFRSCVKHLSGFDLSPELADKARARGCYDSLIIGNVESTLQDSKFDLIFACGLFVYIANLWPVFESVRNSLKVGGIFCFSAECLEGGNTFVLQSCARFAHERSYIDSLAKEFGFEQKAIETSRIRKHEGKDVKGILAVWELLP
jgi:SAM-dependent methyltransferase